MRAPRAPTGPPPQAHRGRQSGPFRRPQPRPLLLPRAAAEAGPGSSRRRPGPSCAALRGGTDVSGRRSRARPRIPPGASGTARGAARRRPRRLPPPPAAGAPPGSGRESLISPGALCVGGPGGLGRTAESRDARGGGRGGAARRRLSLLPCNSPFRISMVTPGGLRAVPGGRRGEGAEVSA